MSDIDSDLPFAGSSDRALAILIFAITGEEPSPSEIASFRRSIERERARRRARREASQDRLAPRSENESDSAADLVRDMLTSPEILALVFLISLAADSATGMTFECCSTLARSISFNRQIDADFKELPYPNPRRRLVQQIIAYLDRKLIGSPHPPSAVFEVPRSALAAINAATMSGLRAWRRRLLSAAVAGGSIRRATLLRIHKEGMAVMESFPGLGLDQPLSDLPLGIWPVPDLASGDPESPPDVTPGARWDRDRS
jgi:hypothetical protein